MLGLPLLLGTVLIIPLVQYCRLDRAFSVNYDE